MKSDFWENRGSWASRYSVVCTIEWHQCLGRASSVEISVYSKSSWLHVDNFQVFFYWIWVQSIHRSKMISNLSKALNFDRLFLQTQQVHLQLTEKFIWKLLSPLVAFCGTGVYHARMILLEVWDSPFMGSTWVLCTMEFLTSNYEHRVLSNWSLLLWKETII